MATILVADEDTRTRNIIRLIFEQMDYKVVSTWSGMDAVLKSKRMKPDVVLADVSLSDRDGYEVSKEIKNTPSLRNTSVILLADSFGAFDKTKAAEVRADDFTIKPLEPEEIARRVEFLVLQKGGRKGFLSTLNARGKTVIVGALVALLVVFIVTASALYEIPDIDGLAGIESESVPPHERQKGDIASEIKKEEDVKEPEHTRSESSKPRQPGGSKTAEVASRAKGKIISEKPSHKVVEGVKRGAGKKKYHTKVGLKASKLEEKSAPDAPEKVELKAAVNPIAEVKADRIQMAIDLTGEWRLVDTIERTVYGRYQGMQLGYLVSLQQDGKNITGEAVKWWEDGRKLPPTARSQVYIEGVLIGNTITAIFVEQGTQRTSKGSFTWVVLSNGKKLQGNFTSTAAKSSGTSVGSKIL